MPDNLKPRLLVLATEVYDACKTVHGSVAEQCKNSSMVLALHLASLDLPIAICQGEVIASCERSDHYWCRAGGYIVDVTAEQFGFSEGPFIEDEALVLDRYKEESFFVISPSSVLRLLAQVQTDVHKETLMVRPTGISIKAKFF